MHLVRKEHKREEKKKKILKDSMRSSWVYSIGIRDSNRVWRDERESEDEKDNGGEGEVKALVRFGN